MADGRDQPPAFNFRRAFPWTEIFRCFQVALDPRKLAVAALGILATSLGWYLLSAAFYYKAPIRTDPKYGVAAVARDAKIKPGTNVEYTEAEREQIGQEQYELDYRKWTVMDELAGPYGKLSTMPWDEYRGPNPYLFVTDMLGGTGMERRVAFREFAVGSVPVLVEPLVKFLVPVTKLVSPDSGALTRLFTLLAILWFLVVWGFAGGVITRLAAIGLTNKGPTTLRQAVRFVAVRYTNYLLSPMVPLLIIGAVVVGLIVYGLLALIPVVGDVVLLGFGLPLVVAAGAVMSVFLIGLVGYPLMYTTLSTEGDSSDTFDALSRSINYVYQAPWHYLWYSLVAIAYGAIVTFFVLFFTSLSVYLGKWAVSQTPLNETFNRKPDFLFMYAPQSFGWQELLLKGSPAEVAHAYTSIPDTTRMGSTYLPAHPVKRDELKKEFYYYNWAGAGMVTFWLALIFLLMLGFIYSFYWSAATAIYLLMRLKVDEAEMDEIYLEEDEPEVPLAPAKPAPSSVTPLNVIQAAPSAANAAPPTTPTSTPTSTPSAPVERIVVSTVPSTPADAPPSPATLPFSPPPPPLPLVPDEPKPDGTGPKPLL